MRKFTLLRASALAVLAIAMPAHAQDAPAAQSPGEIESDEEANTAQDIIVTGRLTFRNRTEDANPVLSYDLEYFQRFEPVSVGEMLKRVPGVTFTSDVLEYDGVQFRGLPQGFTQVLINGRRAPGGEADGSFFVDRLPAELVERIEIVRSPRADQPSEGVAGTLNVITKESTSFEGGFAKAGILINEDDGEVRPSGAIAYAGRLSDTTTFWAGLNYQERRNPKKKISDRFAPDDDGVLEFDNRELQDDTRDGTDISGNAEITTEFAGGRLRVAGLFVDTDRDEDETSLVYVPGDGDELELDEVEVQRERIDQKTYAITADGEWPVGPGTLGLAAGWSAYREFTTAEVDAGSTLEDAELAEGETLDIDDDEYSGTVFYQVGTGDVKAKFGTDLLFKTRDGANPAFEIDDGEVEDETVPGAIFRIEEERYSPYLRLSMNRGPLEIDAGARYEITRRDTTSDGGAARYEDDTVNPTLAIRYAATADDVFRVSVARTVRRPNYDQISPYEQEETPGDGDVTIGNPQLRNEKAWGVDVGYERRLGTSGIFGVNAFYRDIADLTELVNIGDVLEEDEDDVDEDGDTEEEIQIGNVYTPRNIGDGEVWGVEVDFSAPLSVFGLPDTGLFANYTYLDSKTIDPFTGEERRFNGQPHHVYNVGFIQTVRSVGASFGASVSGRSSSFDSAFDETVELTYRPDLEAFVEKRFGDFLVLRVTASNLLNRVKRETYRKYDGDSLAEVLENRAAGELDEFELEQERAGRLFQVTARAAF